MSAPLPVGPPAADRLATGIGAARAIDPEAVPSAVRWQGSVVVDEKRAAFFGALTGEPIALTTDDAGRTWRTVRGEQTAWSSWAIADDGTLALASGTRAAGGGPHAIDSIRVAFAAADATTLSPANNVWPLEGAQARPKISVDDVRPVALGRDAVAFLVEEAPGRAAIRYAGPPGVLVGQPLPLPAGERPVCAPLGRPPMLVTARGRALLGRRLPGPGAPLGPPTPIPSAAAPPLASGVPSRLPTCEAGPWGFARITHAAGGAVLAVAPERGALIPVPREPVAAARPRQPAPSATPDPETTAAPAFGCGLGAVVLETRDAKGEPSLLTCSVEAGCVAPEANPFRAWAEPHRRRVVATSTSRGTIALYAAQADERWGLYLVQSADGKTYELPRVVAEGSGDRGRLEVGGLVSLGGRSLLLVAGDVVGTSRRGWYVMASDDGGATWQ